MNSLLRRVLLCVALFCVAPMLMAPSGGIQGCVAFFNYQECVANQTRECYSGPAGTSGKGICKAGTQTCQEDGTWSKCEGEVTPGKNAKETCNGLDDDCDGNIDEDLTPPPCERQSGVCKGAVQRCDGTNGWLKCNEDDYKKVAIQAPFADKESESDCDGKDNDCDGEIDEECTCQQGQTQPCGYDKGICTKGSQTCTASGKWGECTGGTQPTKEVCDGKDNDCNGQTDETKDICPQGESCNNGKCEGGTTGPTVIYKGTFVGASNHNTVGDVEIVKDGSKETVVIKSNFQTDSGPELRVYLVNDPKGATSGNNYIDIAPLKSTSGAQMYELPSDKSIKDFQSVVIWCRPFGVNFGYATLTKP